MHRLPAPNAVPMRPAAIPRPNARSHSVAIPNAVTLIAAVRNPNVVIPSAVTLIVAVRNPNVALMPVAAICHLLPVRAMNTPVARKELVAMNMLAASRLPVTWGVLRLSINRVANVLRASSIPISVVNARHNISAKALAAPRCTTRKVLAVAGTAFVALIAAKVLL